MYSSMIKICVVANMLKSDQNMILNALIAFIVWDAGTIVKQRRATGEQAVYDYHR